MTYKELDLKSLREKLDLDFAHYTFQPGQCSCCYGPDDQPSIYWKDRKVLRGEELDQAKWILFKNADNGSGHVKGTDQLCCHGIECILWSEGIGPELLQRICDELQSRVGPQYKVIKPDDRWTTIIIEPAA